MTLQQLLQKLQPSGIRFVVTVDRVIRTEQYRTPNGARCCPLNALYQHETGKKTWNGEFVEWMEHFEIERDVVDAFICGADSQWATGDAGSVRSTLLALIRADEAKGIYS